VNVLSELLRDLPSPDERARAAVRDRADHILRPAGALARLDDVAVWLAGWQRTSHPAVETPAAVIFAADHGVAHAEVSAYPAEVTKAMLEALRAGVATATAMGAAIGMSVETIDVGVGEPTGDIRVEAALDDERFGVCVQRGRDAVARAAASGVDLLVFGEMGIGNTTVAAAVCAGLFGESAAAWTGRGTGLDPDGLARKVVAVQQAADRVRGASPCEVLREVGGAELAAIAGAVVEARLRSIPVILDGFVVGAAVAPLAVERQDALDHCVAGHRSAEPGHTLLLQRLGLAPLIDLQMRLGEASGAMLAVPIVRLAAVAVTDVATFEEWGLA
jgi:nicotinate-nucleotide--dimethylbenzimidazole phosphoribosyltransferase